MHQDASTDGRYTRHEGRRKEVLDAAVAYIVVNGLSDLSMRQMATELGISHRMLVHHFGSKDEMVERVLGEMRARMLQQLQETAQREDQDVLTMQDESWALVSAPSRLPFWRAFFEIYAVAAKDPKRHGDFLDSVVNAWLPDWIKRAVAQGIPKARAEALATLVQDACRGFLLDLLTTGDHARVERAYRLLRGYLKQELDTVSKKSR
jgi:AcrR family transcriptional regulator